MKVIKENFTENGKKYDYKLEDGTNLHESLWNGKEYVKEDMIYTPVYDALSYDDDGEADAWYTVAVDVRSIKKGE